MLPVVLLIINKPQYYASLHCTVIRRQDASYTLPKTAMQYNVYNIWKINYLIRQNNLKTTHEHSKLFSKHQCLNDILKFLIYIIVTHVHVLFFNDRVS